MTQKNSNLKKVFLRINDLYIFQTENGQPVTSDVGRFVEYICDNLVNHSCNILELGSGNGIISIMLFLKKQGVTITGLEIQGHLVELSRENNALTKCSINFIHGDLRDYRNLFAPASFNAIVANPPFHPATLFRMSPFAERAISRQEIMCNLDDILSCCDYLLSKGGNAFLLYPEARLTEIKLKIKNVDLIIGEEKVFSDETKIGRKKVIIRIEKC